MRFLAAIVLSSCLSTDAEVERLAVALQDYDGDGYLSVEFGGEDCNDDDPQIHPDAVEKWYDGVDRDCSGGSDFDKDGDQFDAAEYGGRDCDDDNDDVFPGSLELCGDNIDNNCDSFIDESNCG